MTATPPARPAGADVASAEPPGLVRVLGVWDIVFITVIAVTGLRWITRGARVGAPSMLLWIAAWLAFFVPLAVAVAVLARRYPEQGGVYAWVTRAFGPFNAVVCGWCLWVNNLFYFPALLLFAAANAAVVLAPAVPGLGDNRTFSTVFVLGFLWFTVAVTIRGFTAGRWLQTLGVAGTWIPVALLIVGAAVALSLFGSATSFAPAELVPRTDLLGTIALWSTFCFAFSGFEIGAFAGQEVKRPERTLPLGIAIAGAMVTVIYLAGTASVLVAVPADSLAERSGLADAVDAVASRVGLPALGLFTALLLCVASIAGTSSWMAGCARVAYAAGRDGRWPASLARLHPVHGTPHVALVVQGVVSSLIFVSSLFLTFGGQTSVQEAYDILVNLTILVYFAPYLYLFVALVRLERGSDRPAAQAWGLRLAATVGFGATAISMALVFLPPEGTTNVFNYEANLVLQTAAVIAVGLGLWIWGRRGAPR